MQNQKKRSTPTVSRLFDDGQMVELVYRATEHATQLAVWSGADVTYVPTHTLGHEVLAPVPATNNLIRHEAVLLPEQATDYGTVEMLVEHIRAYIDRYVDLSEPFRAIVPIYVLLSWVYDAFNEVPYLRFRGDFGSGKTRALQVIGSILYKPFFASGASTISPVFHTLDLFRGTLVLDETDLRYSDERSDMVKIFNNGTTRGMPVLRTIVSNDKEFNPRAFTVFGPKIVAMRHGFRDEALESRMITEEMGDRLPRTEMPISLPKRYADEARSLRNMLLMYRFRTRMAAQVDRTLVQPQLAPRVNQMFLPLLSLAPTGAARAHLLSAARDMDAQLRGLKAARHEALLLPVLASYAATEADVSIQELADEFGKRHGSTLERAITARYVGSLVRTRLHLPTHKRHGTFVVPFTPTVRERITQLCARYGVGEDWRGAPNA